ncbi:hypothetical protein VC83_04492 [Pseudogymnoascus destructans]|uniref:AB hydrolase-1 domain-containing protein n=1 Tax=Pseudogymnoascus destructans TaxID=655981 RepID=A0A177AAU8_9PEZI|nr:uncharacterized protein VC83_04492 [Pseudogymnoascus destructans]OAF59268.1 hypothetical protein VC83_04492 [Pseudogymnoascus destructans]
MSTYARQNQTFTLPDGRQLGYTEYGDRNGTPLLYFHGYPSCRLGAYAIDDIARRQHTRLLALDRPGFGLSTPQPKRSIADWPADASAFAKSMQLSRFAVLGASGVAGAHTTRYTDGWPERWRYTGRLRILDVLVRVSTWVVHSGPVSRRIDPWLEQEDTNKEDGHQDANKTSTMIYPRKQQQSVDSNW